MDIHAPSNSAPNGGKSYISLPPEIDLPDPIFSVKFVVFAIFVIGAAAVGGAVQSGRISLDRLPPNPFFNAPKAVAAPAQAPVAAAAAPAPHVAPAATPAPVPPLKPDTFVVTSISIGAPSFAIINGTSRVEGDPVEAPGVTGWRVRQIVDGAVVLQNRSTLATLPLSTPGFKPLDDELHPLN
jgi:hypothetical protein